MIIAINIRDTEVGLILSRPGQNINNPLPASLKSPFVTQFEFTGTLDTAPNLCIPASLAFRRDVFGGEEAIQRYCFLLAQEAGKLIAQRLDTEVLENEKGTLSAGTCFANVRLPIDVLEVGEENVGAVTQWMTRTLIDDYNTFIAMMFYGGAWWVRLSAQIYLEIGDFEWGANVLQQICERVRKGAWKPATMPVPASL